MMNLIIFFLVCGMLSGYWWIFLIRVVKVWVYLLIVLLDDLRELMRLIYLLISGVVCDGIVIVMYLRY